MSYRPKKVVMKELDKLYNEVGKLSGKIKRREQYIKEKYEKLGFTELRNLEAELETWKAHHRSAEEHRDELEREAMHDWISDAHKNRLKDEQRRTEGNANALSTEKE